MADLNKKNSIDRSREHLANERTFLAWIRTAIALMGFGFVIVKFALFLKQLSLLLEAPVVPSHGYSAILGIFLVGLGALMGLLAFIRYKKVEKQIDEDTWQSSSILDALLTLSVLAVGIFLVVYLIYSI